MSDYGTKDGSYRLSQVTAPLWPKGGDSWRDPRQSLVTAPLWQRLWLVEGPTSESLVSAPLWPRGCDSWMAPQYGVTSNFIVVTEWMGFMNGPTIVTSNSIVVTERMGFVKGPNTAGHVSAVTSFWREARGPILRLGWPSGEELSNDTIRVIVTWSW